MPAKQQFYGLVIRLGNAGGHLNTGMLEALI